MGFAHAWPVLLVVAEPFLERPGDLSIFQGLLVIQKHKQMLLESDWPSSLQSLEADSVTHAQLQNGLPLTGMPGSVRLSAMPLTELSSLHPHNPWILSVAM